jgi:hypothetical protein
LVLRAARRLIGPLLLYGAVVCWLTWPLAARLATHLPATCGACTFDTLYTAWALSWQTHALASATATLLGANIYHPAPDALLYGPPAFGAVPYFGTVFASTGNPALALNLLFLGSAVLAAALVHAVVRWWTGVAAAGFVAGCTFLASRWLFWDFGPTAPQFAVVFYLPLVVDLACAPRLGWRATFALFLLVFLQGLSEIVYLAPAVMAPLVAIAVARLARPATRHQGVTLLAVVGLAALLLVALHWPYFGLLRRTPDLSSQSYWPTFEPRPLELPWDLLGVYSPVAVPGIALALIAAGAVKALVRRARQGPAATDRLWKHAALWVVVGTGTVISLRERVAWRGTMFTLPHVALLRSWFPAVSVIREPRRLAVSALVGLALLAGLAFAEFLPASGATPESRTRTRLLRGVLAVALAVVMYVQYARGTWEPEGYGQPLPPAYPLQEAIRGDSAVLRVLRDAGGPTIELPLPPQPTFPPYHAAPMYRSIFHWQPLLNGYASYWPRDFPELMTLAWQLPDPHALEELHRRTGLRFVLVRQTAQLWRENLLEPLRQIWRGIAARHDRPDLELIAADDQLLLFRVTDRPFASP